MVSHMRLCYYAQDARGSFRVIIEPVYDLHKRVVPDH
jgi:hypothetical protein